MTPEELQELRDWAGRKIGLVPHTIKDKTCWIKFDELEPSSYSLVAFDWQPDNPQTGQIDMFINRMLELGFDYEMILYADDKENEIKFRKLTQEDDYIGIERNFKKADKCLAILKAARATED